MSLNAEASLMLLAFALYLYDSVLLLHCNEAVLSVDSRGRWTAAFGAQNWRFGSKEPYLANPLTPHRPLFRLRWQFESGGAERAPLHPLQPTDALASLAPLVWGSAWCIFVLLPIGLFMPVEPWFTIAALAMMYATNGIALARAYRMRDRLPITSRQFWAIAVECLLCPPFCINLVRKLCSKISIDESFTAAASRLLDTHTQPEVNAQCLKRLQEQIDYEQEGSARMKLLLAAANRFAAKDPQ